MCFLEGNGLIKQTPQDLSDMVKTMIINDFNLDPLRLPSVNVRMDDANVYVTGKILELFTFEDLFESRPNTSAKGTKSYIANSLDQCMVTCLNRDNCHGVSYCSSKSCIINDNAAQESSDQSCSYYESMVHT